MALKLGIRFQTNGVFGGIIELGETSANAMQCNNANRELACFGQNGG